MNPNDPSLRSFINVSTDSHFPIQNLPFGIFSSPDHVQPRAGIAIGDFILDLSLLEKYGFITTSSKRHVFDEPTLNSFIELGRDDWRNVRQQISVLLRHDNPTLRDDHKMCKEAFVPINQSNLHLPIKVTAYTDFYSSKEHASNVGKLFRGKDNALLPNWLHMPVAYNGRASSVVISGTEIHRPAGQLKDAQSDLPIFDRSRKLDFELEMAFIVGKASELGRPVSIDKAMDHIFGMVLMNDWSARDIQQWEYVPLGPFNGKNFATSISPWIVTMDALAPFLTSPPIQEVMPLEYLRIDERVTYDIRLEVRLKIKNDQPITITKSNFRYLYWTITQQLAHHTVSGCRLEVGDIMGSGTISGPQEGSLGSLLEITLNGRKPLSLSNNEQRTFLEDGDEIIMTGYAQSASYRIGFGEVKGRIVP